MKPLYKYFMKEGKHSAHLLEQEGKHTERRRSGSKMFRLYSHTNMKRVILITFKCNLFGIAVILKEGDGLRTGF